MSKIKENNCICLSCGKSFYKAKERIEHGGGKYCSKQCRDIGLTKKQSCICLWCKKEFFEKISRIKVGRGKYCSKKCYNEFLADGNMRGENSPSWKGGEQLVSCFMCKKEFHIKQYLMSKEIHFCSRKCKHMSQHIIKVSRICLTCGKEFFVRPKTVKDGGGKYCSKECSIIGSRGKNYNIENTDRGSGEYVEWRSAVYKRDNYTCQKCGKRGGTLNAHHIIPFSKDKSLRFEVSNGITLCEKCHIDEHKRLRKQIKKSNQIDIFACR